jgi:hypothetical protein
MNSAKSKNAATNNGSVIVSVCVAAMLASTASFAQSSGKSQASQATAKSGKLRVAANCLEKKTASVDTCVAPQNKRSATKKGEVRVPRSASVPTTS